MRIRYSTDTFDALNRPPGVTRATDVRSPVEVLDLIEMTSNPGGRDTADSGSCAVVPDSHTTINAIATARSMTTALCDRRMFRVFASKIKREGRPRPRDPSERDDGCQEQSPGRRKRVCGSEEWIGILIRREVRRRRHRAEVEILLRIRRELRLSVEHVQHAGLD